MLLRLREYTILLAVFGDLFRSSDAWVPSTSLARKIISERCIDREKRALSKKNVGVVHLFDKFPGDRKRVYLNGNNLPPMNAVNSQSTKREHDVNTEGNRNDNDIGRAACRVVALSDGKIPPIKPDLSNDMIQSPAILEKMDAIYHAITHSESSQLGYMEDAKPNDDAILNKECNADEEKELVSVLRTSLEDAGFELLQRRSLDLCEALNTGYLLRLSLSPDLSGLDPTIAQEFYPERFSVNGTLLDGLEEALFDGRVLVFRRGYSAELTKERMLIQKLDYLQAIIVQTVVAAITERSGRIERKVRSVIDKNLRVAQLGVVSVLGKCLSYLATQTPFKKYSRFYRMKISKQTKDIMSAGESSSENSSDNKKLLKLSRYGGSKIRFVGSPNPTDALTPFLVCEIDNDSNDKSKHDRDIYEYLNEGGVTTQYDAESSEWNVENPPPIQLLERTSISNVVDIFTARGRKRVVNRFFEKSKLVEPSYEEIVVVSRNLAEKPTAKKVISLPKFVYDAAEIFEVEDRLPQIPEPPPKPLQQPLEIKAFDDVPMANLQAVLPKTKLVFRPADAFVFDFVSILSFLAVIGSQSYDSPKLDLIAILSVVSLVLRIFFRYSNKLARYDLLVKRFLTSKIAHRGAGALRYVTAEAASQRAMRASLTHSWLLQRPVNAKSTQNCTRAELVETGAAGVNRLIPVYRKVDIDIDAALSDLEDLKLVGFSRDDQQLVYVCEENEAIEKLKTAWTDVFDGNLSFKSLMERRNNVP